MSGFMGIVQAYTETGEWQTPSVTIVCACIILDLVFEHWQGKGHAPIGKHKKE